MSVGQPYRATQTRGKNKDFLHGCKRKGFATHTHLPICTAGCYSLFYLEQGVDQCVQTWVSIAAPQQWKRSSCVQSKMEKNFLL